MAVSAEIRLKRFIHYGSETPTYVPIPKGKTRIEFKEENLTAINSLLAEDEPNVKQITDIIMKAFTAGYSVRNEALIFALAMAARQKQSENLRELAYIAVRTICKSAKDLFLFIHFCCQLSPGKGFGKGLIRVVKEWYAKQPPMELLKSITSQSTFYGWSHVDVIKLCHVPLKDNIAFSAIFQYMVRGINNMELDLYTSPEVMPIIEYLVTLNEFRSKDSQRSVALASIDKLGLSLEQVPSEIQRHPWIWAVLIPTLTLPTLLGNLPRLGHMRVLNAGQPIADQVTAALTNPDAPGRSQVTPVAALLALIKYKNITKLPLEAKSRKPIHTKPEAQPSLSVNPKVVDALNNLLASSFKNVRPTGVRFVVAIDVGERMATGRCWRNNNVTPLLAAATLALALARSERGAIVGTFGRGGALHTIRIGKTMTAAEALAKLAGTAAEPVDISQPIMWAKNKVKEVDVFLVITDRQVKQENLMSPVKALAQYRQKLRRPNARLVVCATGCIGPLGIAGPADTGILEIAGFNAEVPRLIEAFAREAF